MVGTEPSTRPASSSRLSTACTPPARCRSSMCCGPEGASLTMLGVRSAISLKVSRLSSTPASLAMASRCSTVLVEQPRAASTVRALRRLALVMNLRAVQSLRTTSTAAGAGLPGEGQTGRVHGRDGGVAGKGEAQGLHDAAHRVGGEQAGAGAAGGAHRVFELAELVGGDLAVEVLAQALEDLREADLLALVVAGQHGAAGDQNHGDVQPGRGHDHAGHDLVAVGDEHQAVHPCALAMISTESAMTSRRHQGVVHALVVHGQAVADADDVELQRDATALVHAVLDLLGDGVEVHMPRDQLVVRVGDADERAVGVAAADAESAQERTMRSPSRDRNTRGG